MKDESQRQTETGTLAEREGKKRVGYRDIWGQREYLKVICANLVNRFGDSIDQIAFTWLVYEITGKAGWSAVVFAANQLPSVLVQPFAGALVEGMDKKKLMVFTDVIRGITTLGLSLLYMTGHLTPYIMLLFTLIDSSVEAFRLPASMALVPKILDEKHYSYGMSLNSSLSTIIQLIGLGTAGFIIGFFGAGFAIAIDGVSFFSSALILAFLKIQESGLRKGKLRIKEYFATLKDGLLYLKDAPTVRNFCLLAVLLNAILTPLNSLQSPLIYEVLGQGSGLLCAFALAFTAGMGLGSILYPFFCGKFSLRTQVTGLGITFAICMYAYTLGEYFKTNVPAIYVLTIALSVILGISISLMTSAVSVCFMKSVQKEYLARAGSIFNAGTCAATPAASLIVSALTAICPVAQIFKICALFCVIIFAGLAVVRIRLE